MTIYDLPHVTVTERIPGRMYLVVTDEGWYMHCPEYGENVFKTAGTFSATYDFTKVQIVAEADLPPEAEINGGTTEPDHEVM